MRKYLPFARHSKVIIQQQNNVFQRQTAIQSPCLSGQPQRKKVCACVEIAVAARKPNIIKSQRASHTVRNVLCMCRARDSRL